MGTVLLASLAGSAAWTADRAVARTAAAPLPAALVRPAPRPAALPPALPAGQVAGAEGLPAYAETMLHVPVLNFQAEDDVCRTWISLQSIGPEPSKAVLVAWGEPSFCPPNAAGPYNLTCSGLLQQGSRWSFLGAQIPTGAHSAILYGFTARRLSEIGVDLGFDDMVADYMCETLYWGTVGDDGDYRDFAAAYRGGGRFAGLPMESVRGAPMTAQVLRHCPGSLTPGVEVSGSYAALPPSALGRPDGEGKYRYQLPMLYSESSSNAALGSVIYFENAGLECSGVEVWTQLQQGCDQAKICDIFTVAPGETYHLPLATCFGPAEIGSAWIRSAEPLAIAVDTFGLDMLTTYTATAVDALPEDSVRAPASLLVAPVGPPAYAGGRLEVILHLANADAAKAANLRATLYDRDGVELESQALSLCPLGSDRRSFELEGEAAEGPGLLRVESLAEAGMQPAVLSGLIEVSQQASDGRLLERVAIELLPELAALGQGRLALPFLNADLRGTGEVGEIAIANLARSPGETQMAVMIFDANGLREELCLSLQFGETRYLDLARIPFLPDGFSGSALVSATSWSHDGGSPDAVGLLALAIQRNGAPFGEPRPGDPSAATLAMPLPAVGAGGPEAILPISLLCQPAGLPQPTPRPVSTRPDASVVELHAPTINYLHGVKACTAQVTVTNTGTTPAKVIGIFRGEPGFCAPECSADYAIRCSGLLAPNETWHFATDGALGGSAALSLYSLGAQSLRELGVTGLPGDPLAADYICDLLTAKGRNSCDISRRFRLAFRLAQNFEQVPMVDLLGPTIEVEIERDCLPTVIGRGPISLEVPATVRYEAITQAQAEASGTGVGGAGTGYAYSIAYAFHQDDEGSTVLYLQNLGLGCNTIDIRLVEAETGAVLQSQVFTVASADTFSVMARDLVHRRCCWKGSIVIRSAEPLAILVEDIRSDSLTNRYPFPGPLPFDVNEDGRADPADRAAIEAALGVQAGDAAWHLRSDLIPDGRIDRADLDWFDANQFTGPLPTASPFMTPTRVLTRTPTALPTTEPILNTPTVGVRETATPNPTPLHSPILLPYLRNR
jgi:hypothetical protein